MTYQEWIKKYATDKYDNPMDNFFWSFNRWLEKTPKAWAMYAQAKKEGDVDYRKALDIMFANGITEK